MVWIYKWREKLSGYIRIMGIRAYLTTIMGKEELFIPPNSKHESFILPNKFMSRYHKSFECNAMMVLTEVYLAIRANVSSS